MSDHAKSGLAAIERRFHDVINGRCGRLDWAKDPDRAMPQIAENLLGKKEREWFPVPGMYGGFAYALAEEEGRMEVIAIDKSQGQTV